MDTKSRPQNITAFTESEEKLRQRHGNTKLNSGEFSRKLTRCELSCGGMCCYGGVSVEKDTADVVQQLATERKSDFKKMGLDLPDKVVAPTEWRGVVSNITALKPRSWSNVNDYPNHFDETACVFLMDDARCGLQVLSEIDGKHPWYYKPFSCWLLPIKIWEGEIRLFDKESDPFLFPDYQGFISCIRCGRTDKSGLPASELLKPELEYLGKILGRDLIGELAQDEQSDTAAKSKP